MRLITSSAVFAAEAHSSQVRKELNEPYIIHPLKVGHLAAQLEQDEEFIAACHLHDVPEDTKIPIATIKAMFPEKTYILVDALTKWWGTDHPSPTVTANKQAYYQKILDTPGAPLLKLLDRIDNLYDFAKMARMSPSNHRWATNYYTKTLGEFPRILHTVLVDDGEVGKRAVDWFNVALEGLRVTVS